VVAQCKNPNRIVCTKFITYNVILIFMNKNKEYFYNKYFDIISFIEKEVKILEKYYSEDNNYECTSNCSYNSECCKVPLKIYPVELEAIKSKMKIDNFVHNFQSNFNNKTSCKYLVDNICSIYNYRPIICRIFGIIHKRNGNIIGPDCGTKLLERLKEQEVSPIKFLDSDIIFNQIEKLNREFLHFNKQFQLVKFQL